MFRKSLIFTVMFSILGVCLNLNIYLKKNIEILSKHTIKLNINS